MNISASYMEIYKEEVYDLLVDRESVSHLFVLSLTISYLFFKAPKLPVRENEAGQVFVAYLSAIPLSSVSEFDRIYSWAKFMDKKDAISTYYFNIVLQQSVVPLARLISIMLRHGHMQF